MTAGVDLNNKLFTPQEIAEKALGDAGLLHDLLAGVGPQTQKSARRENCSQALMYMAETWPETLLPHWDTFVGLLTSGNGYSQYVGIYVITSLAGCDNEGRVKRDLERYLALLTDDSVMVASHAALNAAHLAKADPSLQETIESRLMQIDKLEPAPRHIELIKAYIIEALDALYPSTANRPGLMDFVMAQVNSSSQKTKKLAKEILRKWQVLT